MDKFITRSVVAGFKPPMDLDDATVFLTGGTGSFGQAFTRYVVENFTPRRFVVFSRDEVKQFDMQQVFSPDQYPFMRYFIGDVRDADRLEMAMWDTDFVIHAAALKQVPTAEYNPFECIHTNVLGAENVVRAAVRLGVKRVVALSTDKAANPVNLYGASKLASDKIFVAANNFGRRAGSLFSVVRYGNVMGSRGSVVEVFRRLMANGADHLPITDERMTRFWITVEEGVRLVLWTLANMNGGEIMVPRIPSMRVVDLARAMAPDLPHKVVGIRPAEKLHESMIPQEDARNTVDLGDRFVIEPALNWWNRESYAGNGTSRVPEDFTYRSDLNDEWLEQDDLRAMLEKIP